MEGSRRATCVCFAASGRGNPLSPALFEHAGSGHPLSGTTPEASAASQSTPGSLQCTCKHAPLYNTEDMCIYCNGVSREDSSIESLSSDKVYLTCPQI